MFGFVRVSFVCSVFVCAFLQTLCVSVCVRGSGRSGVYVVDEFVYAPAFCVSWAGCLGHCGSARGIQNSPPRLWQGSKKAGKWSLVRLASQPAPHASMTASILTSLN